MLSTKTDKAKKSNSNSYPSFFNNPVFVWTKKANKNYFSIKFPLLNR